MVSIQVFCVDTWQKQNSKIETGFSVSVFTKSLASTFLVQVKIKVLMTGKTLRWTTLVLQCRERQEFFY